MLVGFKLFRKVVPRSTSSTLLVNGRLMRGMLAFFMKGSTANTTDTSSSQRRVAPLKRGRPLADRDR